MDDSIICDYTFDEKVIHDAEGIFPIILPHDASLVEGPGSLLSINIGPSGGLEADISDAVCENLTKFHAHLIFSLNSRFEGRQVLAECEKIHFRIELIGTGDSIKLAASICSASLNWSCIQGEWQIRPEIWHSMDLVYNGDTLTLFQDHHVVAYHGFGSAGEIVIEPYAHTVLIGGKGDTRFDGRIAKFTLTKDVIPADLEQMALNLKITPQWHMTTKLEMLRNIHDLGAPTSGLIRMPRISSWWQSYSNGALMYHSGTAFAMHGEILACYNSLDKQQKVSLGYLISDEEPLFNPNGRKNVFQGGAIYFSKATGAVEVTGEIYHGFESSGETEKWGFPVDVALPATSGMLQKFEKGTWYYKFGDKSAFSVQGDILKTFVATGGLGRWGYPTSSETAVHASSSGRDIRRTEFEKCSIYWSSHTGAHVVQGDIRKKWQYLGGAEMHYIQELGLPTTEEMDVPRTDGAKMAGFEQGVIIYYGSKEQMVVVYPFKIFLKALQRIKSKEGQGIHISVIVNKGDETIFCQRYPEGKAITMAEPAAAKEIDISIELPTIIKPEPGVPITLTVDVWEEETVDVRGTATHPVHLGKWVQVLDASNAWGLASNGKLVGSAGKVQRIEAQVMPVIEYLYY